MSEAHVINVHATSAQDAAVYVCRLQLSRSINYTHTDDGIVYRFPPHAAGVRSGHVTKEKILSLNLDCKGSDEFRSKLAPLGPFPARTGMKGSLIMARSSSGRAGLLLPQLLADVRAVVWM